MSLTRGDAKEKSRRKKGKKHGQNWQRRCDRMDRSSMMLAAAAGTAAVCAGGCAASRRSQARLSHTAKALGVSVASISPVLSGTGDPTAEKLTEDAKDILLASLNAADPKIGINLAVRARVSPRPSVHTRARAAHLDPSNTHRSPDQTGRRRRSSRCRARRCPFSRRPTTSTTSTRWSSSAPVRPPPRWPRRCSASWAIAFPKGTS